MNSTYDFRIIRVLRQKLNLTLKNLAQLADLTYTTVETIETNKTLPSLKTLDAVAGALQISTSELITLAERKLVQKRTAKVISQADPAKKQHGLDNCKVAFYDKAKIIRVSAKAGQKVHVMQLHENCHEICYVLSGCVELTVQDKTHRLTEDMTILFDGVLDHQYNQVETGEYITVHIPKDIRIIETLLKNDQTE